MKILFVALLGIAMLMPLIRNSARLDDEGVLSSSEKFFEN